MGRGLKRDVFKQQCLKFAILANIQKHFSEHFQGLPSYIGEVYRTVSECGSACVSCVGHSTAMGNEVVSKLIPKRPNSVAAMVN